MITYTRSELQLAINANQLAGHEHYAKALIALYDREFPGEREAAHRAEALPTPPVPPPFKKPVFSTVTGLDFGRAIAAAKRRGNPVNAQISAAVSRSRELRS